MLLELNFLSVLHFQLLSTLTRCLDNLPKNMIIYFIFQSLQNSLSSSACVICYWMSIGTLYSELFRLAEATVFLQTSWL